MCIFIKLYICNEFLKKIKHEIEIAGDDYENPLIKAKWEFIVRNEIKDPNVVLDMSNVRFFQWIQAINDFGKKE